MATFAARPFVSREALRHPVLNYRRTGRLVTTLVAMALAIAFIWPFLCVLGHSFNRMDARLNPLWFVPTVFTTEYYQLMVTRFHFDRYILNSLYVVITSTVLSVFACSLAGYALAKCTFIGRNMLFMIILYIMLLPTQTMLVPRFVVMRQLKLVNNYWGLILPAVGGNAYGIFLMRQFMLQVPTEMLEAARIDGASEFTLFLRVVVPIMLDRRAEHHHAARRVEFAAVAADPDYRGEKDAADAGHRPAEGSGRRSLLAARARLCGPCGGLFASGRLRIQSTFLRGHPHGRHQRLALGIELLLGMQIPKSSFHTSSARNTPR